VYHSYRSSLPRASTFTAAQREERSLREGEMAHLMAGGPPAEEVQNQCRGSAARLEFLDACVLRGLVISGLSGDKRLKVAFTGGA